MAFNHAIILSALITATAGLSFAGGHGGNPAVKARQSHMQLYAHNIGILGAMAKGEAEYDADAASAAAGNLAALTKLNQMSYWPAGTSNAELGDETRALPAIWEEGGFAKAIEISTAMAAAADELAAAAGNGQAAIGGAIGPVGQQCGDCHKAFQQPRN